MITRSGGGLYLIWEKRACVRVVLEFWKQNICEEENKKRRWEGKCEGKREVTIKTRNLVKVLFVTA